MADPDHLRRLMKRLADDGRLIEAGWMSMRLQVIPHNAPPTQLQEMRLAFMAGAQHLFGSIMTALDPGQDATATDIRRLELIDKELREVVAELEQWAKHGRPL